MSLSNNFPTTPPSLNLDFANVKALDPRVTFTRSTTATYYDGVTVAMAEQNLVPNSQNFSGSSWTQDQVTLTGSQTAPDGTSTAWLFTDNVTNSDHRYYMFPAQLSSPSYTYSVYLKNGTRRYALMRLQYSFTSAGAIFDLQTGAVSSTGGSAYFSSSITSVGNGWYRCTVTTNAMTSGVGNVVIAMSNTSSYSDNIIYSGTGDTMYVWGVQLEQRSSVTAYTATTTQPITNYIPVLQTAASGIPRFDHNPTTSESLGLLIEEQRTNICIRSEDFSASGWTRVNSTVSANVGIAPDGTQTADLLIPNSTSSADHSVYRLTGTLTGTYTASCYAKAAGYNFVEVFDGTGANKLRVNLTDGSYTVVGSPAAVSVTAVGNGWYRCSFTRAISSALQYVQIGAISDSAGSAFSGNGFGGVLIWGAQQELGAFPTSYIATTTAAATRNADVASIDSVSSWYDAAEGTLFAESTSATVPSTKEYGVAQLSYGTSINDAVFLEYYPNSTTLAAGVTSSGSTQAFNTGGTSFTVSNGNINKQAIAYKVNDFAYSANGVTPFTDSSGVLPTPGADRLLIGAYGASLLKASICIRRITYYPARLTNAQLQAITS